MIWRDLNLFAADKAQQQEFIVPQPMLLFLLTLAVVHIVLGTPAKARSAAVEMKVATSTIESR